MAFDEVCGGHGKGGWGDAGGVPEGQGCYDVVLGEQEGWEPFGRHVLNILEHGIGNRASDLMLKVQGAEDFPLKIKVGRSTYTLRDKAEARKFALGMLAVLEAKEIEDAADFV